MKLITLMINNQQDVPIDEMRILTSRLDFVIYGHLCLGKVAERVYESSKS
jgi:hypothetical protein